jgi:presequence protease
LNESDKKRIFEDGKKLAEVQKAHEDINCLPCLKIDDISTPEKHELKILKAADIPLQLCPTDTNGIVYFRGMLDASMLDDNERRLLPLFAELVTQFGTKSYDYREFDTLVSSKTAGLSFNVHLNENVNDYSLFELGLQFGSYSLMKNSQDMFNIFAELLNTVEFNDVNRFEMLLENYISNLTVGIAQSGHLYAMQNSGGLVTECAMLRESMTGLEHLNYIKALTAKGSNEILEIIKGMAKKILQKSPVRCALNVTESDANKSLQNVEKFMKQLPIEKGEIHWNRSSLLNSNSRHNILNIPVNYCAKSLATVPYAHNDYSTLRVLARILSSKYLLPVVREQNGAYGAGAKLGLDGLFYFFSYRDPNSLQTLDTFDKSFNWIQENAGKVIDDQALFEAKLGVLQQLDAPISKMDQGMENFKFGLNFEQFSQHRSAVLKTSLNDIRDVSEKYLKDDNKTIVGRSIIGPANVSTSNNAKWIINDSN